LQLAFSVQVCPFTVAAPLPGNWAVVAEPLRLLNAGCAQFAFPDTATPVAKVFPVHCVGAAANAVAVAALPEVLLVIEVGKSAATSARKVGVAADPEGGPAKIAWADWVRSCGVSVPVEVTGEPETVELKMIPSPDIPTLATEPAETNMVRTSVIVEIAELLVTTSAMGMAVEVKPVVLNAGAQLLAVLRYT
jgi:hypothetical protein